MATSKKRHLRIICPHCGKNVSLAPPRGRLGFIRPVPCPACHIPIQPAHIKAQTEPAPETAEAAEAEAPASEEGEAAEEDA